MSKKKGGGGGRERTFLTGSFREETLQSDAATEHQGDGARARGQGEGRWKRRRERPCGRTHLFDRIPEGRAGDGEEGGGRLRDATKMTQHEAARVSEQEEGGGGVGGEG